MIKLRTWCMQDCTVGRLECHGFHCFTLELPWLENQRNISCIPAGTYRIDPYRSAKHGKVILFHDVPGRTYIEIHAGNYTRQIEGCILVGDSLKYLDVDGIPDVTNSRATLAKLVDWVGPADTIVIERTGLYWPVDMPSVEDDLFGGDTNTPPGGVIAIPPE